MVLLEVVDLACERGERLLFAHLSFALEVGALIQIEGRNGAGKTSLLRILCGLAQPSSGITHWRGDDIHRYRQKFLSELLYLGHHHGVKGLLTPEENLKITCGLNAIIPQPSEIKQALNQVGLGNFYDYPCQNLSAGQKRRVALARLIIGQATLWILDEPFTSLDRFGVLLVEKLLIDHLASGGAAVITTHHPLQINNYPIQRINLDHQL